MNIDKNEVYSSGNFVFRNFTSLTRNELLMILHERNHPNVKKWMFSDSDIDEVSHLNFVNGLKDRKDAFYWLMYYNDRPIGVFSLVHCDFLNNVADPGYYLFAEAQNSGIGLEMHLAYKQLCFHQLGVQTLASHILWGNTSAMQLTLFYGGHLEEEQWIDGKRFAYVRTSKENFDLVDVSKLASRFVKFIKANPIKW